MQTHAAGARRRQSSGPTAEDSFTEAANTNLGTHTLDSGGGWSGSASGSQVEGGTGLLRAANTGPYRNWVDLGAGNPTLVSPLYTNNNSSSHKIGHVFRVTDQDNLLMTTIRGSAHCYIYKRDGGTETTLAWVAGLSPVPSTTTAYEFKTVITEDLIECYWNEGLVLSHTISGAEFATFPTTIHEAGLHIGRTSARMENWQGWT